MLGRLGYSGTFLIPEKNDGISNKIETRPRCRPKMRPKGLKAKSMIYDEKKRENMMKK